MTGPLAQQIAQLDAALVCFTDGDCDTVPGMEPCPACVGRAALSVIERHVQDMETALRARLSKGHNDTCSALLSEGCACDCGMVETISVLAALPAREKGTE